MEQMVLKQEIVESIKKDQELFGKVAKVLGISIRTMSDLLPSNPPRLANASVLKVLSHDLKIRDINKLIEPELEKV